MGGECYMHSYSIAKCYRQQYDKYCYFFVFKQNYFNLTDPTHEISILYMAVFMPSHVRNHFHICVTCLASIDQPTMVGNALCCHVSNSIRELYNLQRTLLTSGLSSHQVCPRNWQPAQYKINDANWWHGQFVHDWGQKVMDGICIFGFNETKYIYIYIYIYISMYFIKCLSSTNFSQTFNS